MTRFLLRRTVYAIVVVFVVVTIVFLLSRASGSLAAMMAPDSATPEDLRRLTHALGLDEPLYIQYLRYLRDLATGNLGYSFSYNEPVANLIGPALPASLALAAAAFLYAAILGVFLGTVSAIRSGSWLDVATKGVALVGQSIPSFWLGIILVLVFAANLRILPAFGADEPASIVLPMIALGSLPLATTTRLTRSAVLEGLRADHHLFERSKGVGRRLLTVHLLRNAALPIVTLSGVQLGQLISGTVVVETVFAWPGMGRLVIEAVLQRDYAVVQGVVLVYTAIIVTLSLLVDVSYAWLDPRLKRN